MKEEQLTGGTPTGDMPVAEKTEVKPPAEMPSADMNAVRAGKMPGEEPAMHETHTGKMPGE